MQLIYVQITHILLSFSRKTSSVPLAIRNFIFGEYHLNKAMQIKFQTIVGKLVRT